MKVDGYIYFLGFEGKGLMNGIGGLTSYFANSGNDTKSVECGTLEGWIRDWNLTNRALVSSEMVLWVGRGCHKVWFR